MPAKYQRKPIQLNPFLFHELEKKKKPGESWNQFMERVCGIKVKK